jgi:hypothetical protein
MKTCRLLLPLARLLVLCQLAFPVDLLMASSNLSGGSDGPMAFVEWNPAAIREQTVAVSGEYLVVDGVAFGALLQVTDFDRSQYSRTSVQLGASVTQYPFSSTLNGLYLRGTASVFGDQFRAVQPEEEGDIVESGMVFGAAFGAQAGYRFMFTEHITGSAGYGLVRNVPEFFSSSISDLNSAYRSERGEWRLDVHAGIGVSL